MSDDDELARDTQTLHYSGEHSFESRQDTYNLLTDKLKDLFRAENQDSASTPQPPQLRGEFHISPRVDSEPSLTLPGQLEEMIREALRSLNRPDFTYGEPLLNFETSLSVVDVFGNVSVDLSSRELEV